jgi:hypothetical protein
MTDAIDFEKLYGGAPRMPWDIGGPQPLLERPADRPGRAF